MKKSTKRSSRRIGLLTISLFLWISFFPAQAQNTHVHDPVMIEQDDTYYLFSTGWGISVQSSTDMKSWSREMPVFSEPPDWVLDLYPDFRNHIWAPDIAEHNGTFYLYYSVSQFGSNNSAIGVATNQTLNSDDPNFEWKDHGPVVQSVPGRDMWNAIDPNLTFNDEGTPWLTFGSYWLGIKIVKLDDNLMEIASPESWHTIASRHRYWKIDERDAGSRISGDIEAPFIVKKNDFYYLFASWDQCCSGKESTYKIVVGRSKNVNGPYFDKAGQKLIHGGGTLVAKGNDEKWAAVGHNAAYSFDGTDYLVFHGYDNEDEGNAKLIIKEISWDNGWPTISLK